MVFPRLSFRRGEGPPSALPDALICDLDGSLTQISAVAARLASIGDKYDLPVSAAILWILQAGNRAYRALGRDIQMVENIRRELLDDLSHERDDAFLMLVSAMGRRILCYLSSNGPSGWGHKILRDLSLAECFRKVVFREDAGALKPDVNSIRPILEDGEIFGKRPLRVWIYGDRASDAFLAHNANGATAHRFIPVGIKGTQAADAIGHMMEKGIIAEGIVFDDLHAMTCAFNPELEGTLDSITHQTRLWFETIDSFRPS